MTYVVSNNSDRLQEWRKIIEAIKISGVPRLRHGQPWTELTTLELEHGFL